MHRRSTLVFSILFLAAFLALPSASMDRGPTIVPVTVQTMDVEGRGWTSIFGCLGCISAGALIWMGGPASIAAAIWQPGSTVAVAACIGFCTATVRE